MSVYLQPQKITRSAETELEDKRAQTILKALIDKDELAKTEKSSKKGRGERR